MKAGITLIALVITIIVLIILAMVTIAMLTGPNGLLSKSLEAKIANDKAEIQDRAETEVLGSIGTNGKIDWGELKQNLASNFEIEEETIKETKDGENVTGLTFTVEKNNRSYEVDIDEKGKVTVKGEGETSGGGSSSSTEPSTEPSEEVGLKPGDQATSTEKDNYEDESGKKATIPQGFTVSSEDYEIDTGLVVEAPDGSEFVWVPVETAITTNEADGNSNKAMAVVDPTDGNNYRGLLYDFSGTTSSVREGCTTTAFTNSTKGYREPAYLTDSSYGDASTNSSYNNGRVTEEGLKEEYKAMIEKVEQYGGFYVGRYETSLTGGNKAQSKKGETPMSNSSAENNWWGMYEKEKNYASINGIESIVGSSMIWGSQYDAMLNWMLKGSDASKVTTDVPKHNKTTTGSTEGDVMNKIYDLGNNFSEWTLEAYKTSYRVARGGFSSYYTHSPSLRLCLSDPYDTNAEDGSRLTLYIK